MRTSGMEPSGRETAARGFAVVLSELDFLDSILFRGAIHHLDYRAYLASLWQRMALARQAGMRVVVAPFLLDQHISYADRISAQPFSPVALRAFDDFAARTCPYAREWRGEAIDLVISKLRTAEDAVADFGRAPPPIYANGSVTVRRPGPDARRGAAWRGSRREIRTRGGRADLPSPQCRPPA